MNELWASMFFYLSQINGIVMIPEINAAEEEYW